MSEDLMEWDEFLDKIDKAEDKKGKHRWKEDATIAFAEEVCELEKTEGRPVYHAEVFYSLDKKVGANGKFSQGVRTKLKEHNERARSAKLIWSVSKSKVVASYKRWGKVITDGQFVSDFSNIIPEKLKAVRKWQQGSKIFSSQEPFLYGLMEDVVKGSVFENMEGGKNEANVALQFARWMLLLKKEGVNYLTLE